MPDLKDILNHVLGGNVPQRFLDHLIAHRADWDHTFEQKIDEFAYEIMPDLAVWELAVNSDGQLSERRISFLDGIIDS